MTARLPVQWLTTQPNPRWRHKTHGADDGQRGWRLHAVRAADTETLEQIRGRRALCGMVPGTGWRLDMFIERRCSRCEAALAKEEGR